MSHLDLPDTVEEISAEHVRAALGKLLPSTPIGSRLYSHPMAARLIELFWERHKTALAMMPVRPTLDAAEQRASSDVSDAVHETANAFRRVNVAEALKQMGDFVPDIDAYELGFSRAIEEAAKIADEWCYPPINTAHGIRDAIRALQNGSGDA